MSAYSELYLDDAMCNLGGMLDYAVNDCNFNLEEFYEWFAFSRIGEQFGRGNPKYVAGMSGVELARQVIFEVKGERIDTIPREEIDKSREYWTGWSLAYYQNLKNIGFAELIQKGLTADFVISRYLLHEADINKFVEVADILIESIESEEESALKRIRTYYNYTQKELSERSGVSLRMIQLYEQGRNDLSKAQAGVVLALANALHCEVTDLIE